jgi:hypothetical protein
MKSPHRSRRKSPCSSSTVEAAVADRRPHQPVAARRSILLAYFDEWRDAADDVESSSRHWRAAPAGERAAAALAYFASLEREEKAASAYQLAWEA